MVRYWPLHELEFLVRQSRRHHGLQRSGMLNKTCRFCPHCDLLIAHKDEIELHLAQLRLQMGPAVIGNDYLIVGTVERKDWHRGLTKPLSPAEMIEALHDFKGHLQFEPTLRWVYTGHREKRTKPR